MSVNIPPNMPAISSIGNQQTDFVETDLATAVGNTLKANFDRSGSAKAKLSLSVDLNTQALMDLFRPKETNIIV